MHNPRQARLLAAAPRGASGHKAGGAGTIARGQTLVAERLRFDGSQLRHLARHIDTIYNDATRYDGYLAIAVGALLVAFMARRVMRMTRVRTTEPTPGT